MATRGSFAADFEQELQYGGQASRKRLKNLCRVVQHMSATSCSKQRTLYANKTSKLLMGEGGNRYF